jgi:hypothetical protein
MKPIRYKVLLIDQLSKEDKLTIAAKVTTIFTGPEALANGYKQIAPGKFINEGWQVEIRDNMGHVVVMKYKGVEAALFYKRQTGEVEPLPVDPAPEGVITDPADAWVRLDLLGLSAREAGGRVGKQKKKSDENLLLAEQNLVLKEQLVGLLETEIFNLKKDLEKKNEEIAKLKKAAKGGLSKEMRGEAQCTCVAGMHMRGTPSTTQQKDCLVHGRVAVRRAG